MVVKALPSRLLSSIFVNKDSQDSISFSIETSRSHPVQLVKSVFSFTVTNKQNTEQDAEAKLKTEKDHAEGKPSSETLNKAKVKTEDALT